MENWNDILVSSMRSKVNKGVSLIFFISWIFVGNYVLLNLFTAVLLDGFNGDALKEDRDVLEQDIEIAPDNEI